MKRKFIGAAAAVTAVVAMPMAGSASGNGGHDREPQLLGRAVLPAITIAPGPQSGAAATDANGVDFPIEEGQIVEGFSGVVEGDTPGQFLAMADNGFGAKTNSADFLLRAYVLEPEFRTAEGGSGDIVVRDWIQFRDPYEKIDFPISERGPDRPAAHRCRPRPGVDPARSQRRPVGRRRVRPVDPALQRRRCAPRRRRSRSPACCRPATRGDADESRDDPQQPRLRGHGLQRQVPLRHPRGRSHRRGSQPDGVRVRHPQGGAHRSRVDVPDRGADGRRRPSTSSPTPRRSAATTSSSSSGTAPATSPPLTGFKRVYAVDLRKVDRADGTLVKHELLDMVHIPDPNDVRAGAGAPRRHRPRRPVRGGLRVDRVAAPAR